LNLFIPAGELASFRGRDGQVVASYDADPGQSTYPHLPLTVLVNGSSASASELVSEGLQERGRAVIMGDRTFGKGLQQVTFDLPDGSGFKFTNAEFYVPYFSPQGKGVKPDVSLEEAKQASARRLPNKQLADPLLLHAVEELHARAAANPEPTPAGPTPTPDP
jgi:carboxyl-terminal processing protease